MTNTHVENVTIEEIKIDDVICNCCGKVVPKTTYVDFNTKEPFIIINDYLEISQTWGYHSDYDDERHEFDICPECYKKWINSFKIPVKIKSVF